MAGAPSTQTELESLMNYAVMRLRNMRYPFVLLAIALQI